MKVSSHSKNRGELDEQFRFKVNTYHEGYTVGGSIHDTRSKVVLKPIRVGDQDYVIEFDYRRTEEEYIANGKRAYNEALNYIRTFIRRGSSVRF